MDSRLCGNDGKVGTIGSVTSLRGGTQRPAPALPSPRRKPGPTDSARFDIDRPPPWIPASAGMTAERIMGRVRHTRPPPRYFLTCHSREGGNPYALLRQGEWNPAPMDSRLRGNDSEVGRIGSITSLRGGTQRPPSRHHGKSRGPRTRLASLSKDSPSMDSGFRRNDQWRPRFIKRPDGSLTQSLPTYTYHVMLSPPPHRILRARDRASGLRIR